MSIVHILALCMSIAHTMIMALSCMSNVYHGHFHDPYLVVWCIVWFRCDTLASYPVYSASSLDILSHVLKIVKKMEKSWSHVDCRSWNSNFHGAGWDLVWSSVRRINFWILWEIGTRNPWEALQLHVRFTSSYFLIICEILFALPTKQLSPDRVLQQINNWRTSYIDVDQQN